MYAKLDEEQKVFGINSFISGRDRHRGFFVRENCIFSGGVMDEDGESGGWRGGEGVQRGR